MNLLHRQTWPRLRDEGHEVACHFCDSLHKVELIEEGQSASCLTCGSLLYRNRPQSLERAIAFGLSGIIFFFGMLFLPFITMDAQGNSMTVNAGETVLRLWLEGGEFISLAVFVFIFLLPLTILVSLLYLCIPLSNGRALPGMELAARIFQTVQPWVMVEVFFLGTMVSLLKLMKLADVTMGLGFWSMIALMLSIAASVGGIDRIELWDRIEVAIARKKNDKLAVEGGVEC
ncbi:paraquat-inducible protein A [Akkermansiaceae bacterium]|nr:paraquat-inducible protein A [Akkermansiaceae bacterium]MDB4284649.1 paraquat-inducible protein A [bacterium]MDB4143343.1 paraquat-inducible protein A [Akkermansiaceae bacterium]MDB4274565.1 paraquat-inducible protein A [Akkermansiaceae bacterium]MDB4387999.1 paraquat-inducible protein A [Akkermansiaceae bacterium]